MRSVHAGFVIVVLAVAVGLGAVPVAAVDELQPGGSFVDDDGMPEEGWIEAIRALGITKGCNPPANDRFCPEQILTRAQMASIFERALDLPHAEEGPFTDTSESVHAADIDALAAAGITRGCNPPTNDLFCPTRHVTRGQMAAFIVRALDLTAPTGSDHFSDDDGSIFERDIEVLAESGMAVKCGADAFCPSRGLTRAEMAVFVGRALGLEPIVPPARPFPPAPAAGEGRRIIYANGEQRVWLIDEDERVVDSYLVSGREDVPSPGTYEIYSKSVLAWAGHDGITMQWMLRFARSRSGLAIGFHAIPRYRDGTPMQTEAELGSYQSAGCVRQADAKAEALYAWAPVGTTVIVLP